MSEEEQRVNEHLETVATEQRIKIVQNDSVRRWGQIIMAFVLIGSMISYLGYYTVFIADKAFQLGMAQDMRVLIVMGIGASLAIFGLGRTVGRRS